MVAKEIDRRLGKGPFGEDNKEAIRGEDREELLEVGKVFLEGRAGNQDIIKINENKGKVMEDVVHHPLECLSRVAEAKRHGEGLEEAKGRNDRRFGDVRRIHQSLVVAFDQVQLGEDGSTIVIVIIAVFRIRIH